MPVTGRSKLPSSGVKWCPFGKMATVAISGVAPLPVKGMNDTNVMVMDGVTCDDVMMVSVTDPDKTDDVEKLLEGSSSVTPEGGRIKVPVAGLGVICEVKEASSSTGK